MSTGALLTLDDLAARWGLTREQTKKVVRKERVPFVNLRSAIVHMNWSLIRFIPDAIEEWERSQQGVYAGPPVAPTVVAGGKLGNWRS